MARSRRGSFGLRPRVVPNVTSQIIQLAREYVAKRDALIMDAWRSGGTFEGKKATDEMVLGYWKERSKDLDPGDPDYEAAQNQIMQLTYAIEQSKADLKHVQGKMSDMEYAGFFLRWAKKVPKDSEFYRVLQKDAAQLIESAKNKARVDGERARVEAFNNFVKTTTANDIAIGDALTAAISDLSKATGLSVTGNGDELLALLTQNIKANPGQYRQLLDVIKVADPNWDGVIDQSYFTTHIKQAATGYDMIADRAQKGGYVSAYASATKGEAAMSEWGQNLKVWPVSASYTAAQNAFLRVWNDPNASQMDKQAAAAAFSARLTALANTPGIDAGSKTMIEADAQRLLGQDAGDNPSFGTTLLGRPGVEPQQQAVLAQYTALSTEMAANPTAWAYASVDQNGQFDPTGRGAVGIVPAGAVPPGAQAVIIPGANGQAVMAMVMPHAVYASDPNNPGGSPALAGYQISYNVGGKTVQMWGYKDAQGQNHWSLTSPVAEGATTTIDNKGDVYITPRASAASDPIARARELDAKFGTNIAGQLQAQLDAGSPLGKVSVSMNQVDTKGHITGSFELSYNNGTFTATQKSNTLDSNGHVISSQTTPVDIGIGSPQGNAFSPSRLAAGNVPGVTYNSPLAASVTAANSSQNSDQVGKFANDPLFQSAFLNQTMQTLGTNNPFDPRIEGDWKKITTPQVSNTGNGVPGNPSLAGNQRTDLTFPGERKDPAYQGSLSINFGKAGELRLPGLPSYLGNAQKDFSGIGNAGVNLFNGLTTMLPGLGLAPIPTQTPTGSPTPTAPTVTPVAPTSMGGYNPTLPPAAPPPAKILPGLPPPPPPPKPGQGSTPS